MKGLIVHEVLLATAGICYGDRNVLLKEITAADTDSRKLVANGLFFAIKGNKVDSHRFIKGLFDAGKIVCAVGEEAYNQVFGNKDEEIPGIYIQVKDVFAALLQVSAFYRSKLKTKIIGITGSAGKTGTKELIASVLAQKYQVHKTQGNYNNEIGVPLTIFGMEPEHEIAVIEMGISGFGQMSTLAAVVRPDIMVMSNIGRCHLEELIDRNGVLRAKSEALDYLMPGARVIINSDDDKLNGIREVSVIENRELKKIKPVTVGIYNENADYQAMDIQIKEDGYTSFHTYYKKERLDVLIRQIGEHHVYNALSAIAVAGIFDMEGGRVAAGIEQTLPLAGRSDFYRLGEDAWLLDDCYNANPDSMRAALLSLTRMKAENKLAIIGDMLELGESSEQEHCGIARFLSEETDIKRVCFVGEEMLAAYEEIRNHEGITARYFKNTDELNKELKHIVLPNDRILIKASHSMHFDRIKEFLMLAFSKA